MHGQGAVQHLFHHGLTGSLAYSGLTNGQHGFLIYYAVSQPIQPAPHAPSKERVTGPTKVQEQYRFYYVP